MLLVKFSVDAFYFDENDRKQHSSITKPVMYWKYVKIKVFFLYSVTYWGERYCLLKKWMRFTHFLFSPISTEPFFFKLPCKIEGGNCNISNLFGVYKCRCLCVSDNWVTLSLPLMASKNGFHSRALSLCAPYLLIEYTVLCNPLSSSVREYVTNTIRIINIVDILLTGPPAAGGTLKSLFPYYNFYYLLLCVHYSLVVLLHGSNNKFLVTKMLFDA